MTSREEIIHFLENRPKNVDVVSILRSPTDFNCSNALSPLTNTSANPIKAVSMTNNNKELFFQG